MAFLRGKEIGSHSTAACIVKFLRVRLRLAFYGADIAEVRICAVCPANPKTRRRISLADILPPEEAINTASDFRRTVSDDSVVTLEESNQIIVFGTIFDDLIVGVASKHVFEMG
jgi:hypothetical protein